jgi:hypothetical protein
MRISFEQSDPICASKNRFWIVVRIKTANLFDMQNLLLHMFCCVFIITYANEIGQYISAPVLFFLLG